MDISRCPLQTLISLLPPGCRQNARAGADPEDLIRMLESGSPLPRDLLCALELVLEKAKETRSPGRSRMPEPAG